jgi:hypothetical protein
MAIAWHWFAGAAVGVVSVVGYVWLWRLAPRMKARDSDAQAQDVPDEEAAGRREVRADSGEP